MADPMASQMAKLLADSDLDELREIVDRWVSEAPTEGVKMQYRNFGARLVELKHALVATGQSPTREDLEIAITMMLRFAAEKGTGR